MLKSSKVVQAPIISSIGRAVCTVMLYAWPSDVACELSRPPSVCAEPLELYKPWRKLGSGGVLYTFFHANKR